MSWGWPMSLFAWFTGTISWLCGSQRDKSSIERDVGSGQKGSHPIGEVSYENPFKEEIGPNENKLQTLICAIVLNYSPAQHVPCLCASTFATADFCSTLATETSSNRIGVGVFAHVYYLAEGRVRKIPAPDLENLDLAISSIRREGEIYDHLGDHPLVAKCFAKEDLFVDLEYAHQGHIERYLKSHHDRSDECRIRFAQEVIEAIVFIQSKGIIHSDLAARQFLLDDTLHVEHSDFGFSSFSSSDVLGFENSSHHLPRDIDSDTPSTIQSDLVALGSTLYKIMIRKLPYEWKSDDDIAQLYSNVSFPHVTGILYGHIILGRWQARFNSAAEVLENFHVCKVCG